MSDFKDVGVVVTLDWGFELVWWRGKWGTHGRRGDGGAGRNVVVVGGGLRLGGARGLGCWCW